MHFERVCIRHIFPWAFVIAAAVKVGELIFGLLNIELEISGGEVTAVVRL